MDVNPYQASVDTTASRRTARPYEWSAGPMRLMLLSLVGLLAGSLVMLCGVLELAQYAAFLNRLLYAGGFSLQVASAVFAGVALFGLLLQFFHYLFRS